MRIGILNRRIHFYQRQDIENEVGADEQEDVKVFSTWARIEPARGKEFWEAQKINESNPQMITIRYRTNVTDDMIIKYKNQQYNIKTIIDPNMTHEKLELYCTQELRGDDIG